MSAPVGHNGGPDFDWSEYGGFLPEARDSRYHPIVGYGKQVRPSDPARGFCYSINEAWRDLLHECRYADGYVMNGGRKMLLERGSMVGAISYLAHRWNWTPKTVRGFLDRLEADGMIALSKPGINTSTDEVQGGAKTGRQKGTQAQVISVCNYDKFNMSYQQQGQALRHAKGTQGAREGHAEGMKHKKETREQGNNISAPLQGAEDINIYSSRAGSARVEGGKRKRGGVPAAWLPADKPDGSRDLIFADGKLTVVNGLAASLCQEFQGIDLPGLCNKAAAKIALAEGKERRTLTHLECLALLREQCQWDVEYRNRISTSPSGRTTGRRDILAGLTLEQRAKIVASRATKQEAR